MAGIVLGIIVVAPFLQMLLDRRKVLSLEPTASSISPNPARPGDSISIIWQAKPHRNCAGVVIPRVIDSTGHIYEFARAPTVYQDLMREGDRTFTKTLTLPAAMAAGPARYDAIVVRWCNVLQEYLWPMVDEPYPIGFDVMPAEHIGKGDPGDRGIRGRTGATGADGAIGPRGPVGARGPAGPP